MQTAPRSGWRAALAAVSLSCLAGLPAAAQPTNSDVFDPEGMALLDALVGQQIRDSMNQLTAHNNLSAKLNGMIVAEVKLEDANLQQIMDYVVAMSKELDPERKGINVIATPAAQKLAEGKKVTLKLNNVPLGQVLRYATMQLSLAPKVEQYAVVIDVPQRVGDPGAGIQRPGSLRMQYPPNGVSNQQVNPRYLRPQNTGISRTYPAAQPAEPVSPQ